MNETTLNQLIDQDKPSRQVVRIFTGGVFFVCLLPFLLNLLGFDFGSKSIPLVVETAGIDQYFYFLNGAFTHTILEWTAFTLAICVALLALMHYRVANDVTTLVIGVALLASGCMDAFHTLAADRLIEAVVDNRQLIPFTWAVSRIFQALILILGVSFFLFYKNTEIKQRLTEALLLCAVIVAVAYSIIHYCSTSDSLPQTLFPSAIVTRPWDVAPLCMFLFAGLFLFPRYYQQRPSLFSLSLMISLIPNIILEMHMVFGSSALFDNHSNIAHFLKIIAYFVPFVGMVMDSSLLYDKQQRLIRKLSKTREQSQVILDNAIDGITTINRFGIIQSVNPKMTELFGYDKEEMLGRNVKVLMPEPYQSEHDDYLANHMRTGENKIIGIGREVTGKRKDGSIFPMDLAVTEVKNQDERVFTGFVRDISERKCLEKELQAREALFSSIVNSAPVMVWMTDESDQAMFFNERWLAFTGRTLDEEIAHSWKGDDIHADDSADVMEIYDDAIKTRKLFDHEYRMKNQQGEYFWFRELAVPRLVNGHYQGYVGTLSDITDRKVIQKGLEDSMDKLKTSNQELEQFAYVASHDLQEPLRMVASYTQLLSRRYKGQLDSDADEFIEYAVNGAKRMQVLINNLLDYSRVGSAGKPLISVSSETAVKDALSNLEAALDEGGVVVTHEQLPQVKADPMQLLSVFQNLIGNAIKYRDPEKLGKIHISVKEKGDQYIFSIADNGIGIEAHYFERIFVVFKRLHTTVEKEGTGIGLSVVKKIIERHGGKIWVESTPGEGSTFLFALEKAETSVTAEKI